MGGWGIVYMGPETGMRHFSIYFFNIVLYRFLNRMNILPTHK